MSSGWTPKLAKVELTGAHSKILAWEVVFALEDENTRSEVKTLVYYDCPAEDIVKVAMHQLHQRLEELVKWTARWKMEAAAP